AFLDRLGDDVPVSQAAALEDGVITFEEYEAAYERTVACMRDSGLVVKGPKPENAGRFLTYSFQAGVGGAEADEPCRREHLDLVNGLWLAQAVPSEAEAEVMAREYAACLRSAGVDVEDNLSLQELDFVVLDASPGPFGEAVGKCAELYSLGIFTSDA
ncbi:hypothetical protein MNBD_ACTINO02-3189, partial [hydrothermal vent metagenome]